MNKEVLHMLDAKAVGGTILTGLSAWIDIATPLVGLVVTVVVGGLTAWYTWERAIKLKREREDDK
jgi:hypothetical protein